MGIVILKWNPGFSSYTMARFLNHLEKCALANDGNVGMNWSVWDFDKVHEGDVCYMLKVGYGQTGIVARGIITSDPYKGEDWSWRNRPTQYCDFTFEAMINPDAFPLLNSAELTEAIPDFDWYGGHSGLVLTDHQAEVLERQWNDYLQKQSEYFEKASDQNLFLLSQPLLKDGSPYKMELEENYRNHNNIRIECKVDDVIRRITIYNYHRTLGKFGVKSWRTLQHLFFQNYPLQEDLQTLCADLYAHQITFEASFYESSEEEEEEDD